MVLGSSGTARPPAAERSNLSSNFSTLPVTTARHRGPVAHPTMGDHYHTNGAPPQQHQSSCNPRRSGDAAFVPTRASAACEVGQHSSYHPPPGSRAVSAYSGGSSASQSHSADFSQSTLNLVTCVLGAGALGYPFCFKECGLLLATIMMFVTLVATRISYQLLLYCAQLSGRKSYESISELALGKTGRQVVEVCIACMNLGALVAFLDILADVLSAVAGTIIPPGAEPSRNAYITGVTLLGALPVSLVVREPSVIANMSNAAVVFVVVFAVVVFCTAFGPSAASALGVRWAALTHGGQAALAASSAVKAPVLHMWNPQGVLVSLPVMAYGFTAHQYYMGIYTMLKAPTVSKMKLVTDAALLVCAGVYWTVGVGGYATFGDRTAGDIIRNFGGSHSVGMWGAYERALKLCYGMAVLGNIPLVIMPFSSILAPLLPGDERIKQQTSSLAGACTVAGAKRATAAAFSGCGAGGVAGAGGVYGKARCSGSGGGSSQQQQLGSDGGGGVDLDSTVLQLDAESLVLEAPTWQQHSQHNLNSNSGGGLGSSRQEQQQPLLSPHQQQQQQYQQQQQRATSPEEAPEHPHLSRDACRAAHMLTGPQHTLVVVMVLGVGLASAVWLPNVELIFGLTGSTASVVAAFIMPALCFLRLYEMAPELGSGSSKRGSGGGGSSSGIWRALKQAVTCCGCFGLSSLLNPSSRLRFHRGGSGGPSRALHSSPGSSKRQASVGGGGWSQQGGGGGDATSASPSKVWGPVLVVPELRAQWACRQRLAFVLLAFGLLSGMLCTDAILSSISEEKAVVQLAQELVAHEAVVAETSRAQQKAKEAAAAVDAVSSAEQQLGAVDTATNQTLGSLTAAAAALSTIAAPKDGAAGAAGHAGSDRPHHHSMWDLKGRIEEHKQKVAEDHVLRNVEAALSTATADIAATTAAVTAVIIKLDTSIANIKADAAAAAAPAPGSSGGAATDAAAATAQPSADGSAVAMKAPDGSVVVLPAIRSAGSAAIVPHGGAPHPQHDVQDPQQQQSQPQQQQLQLLPPAVVYASADKTKGDSSSGSSSSSSNDAFVRANEMARELGKALGTFGQGAAGANLTLTAGKSLEQVRDSAIAALTALNVTASVMRQVGAAVGAARNSPQRDGIVKDLAVQAMQRALNATAASALAMRITREALGTAATEETSELLTALTRVAQDLEKDSSTTAGSSGGRKRTSITVTSEDASSSSRDAGATTTAGTAGPAAGAAVAGAAEQSAGDAPAGGGAASGSAAGSASDPITGPSSGGVAAGGDAVSSSGADAAPAVQQQQPAASVPRPKHLISSQAADQEAAAAAAANAAAHAESESNAQAQQQQQLESGQLAGDHVAGGTAADGNDKQPSAGEQHASAAAAAAAAANVAAHADSIAAQPSPSASGSEGTSAGGGSSSHSSSSDVHSDAGSSSSSDSTHLQAAPAGGASSSSSDATHAPVLSETEASKIKTIIGHLASALSSGSSAGSSGSTGGSSTGSSSQTAPANITELAAAIHDAVTWTQQSKSAVLGLIASNLGSNPRVAERVMSIVQEVSETTKSEADQQQEQQQAADAAAVALTAADASQPAPTVQQEPAPGDEHTQEPQDDVVVAGPVVTVTPDGQLQQQEEQPSSASSTGVEGPVVAAATTTGAAADTAADEAAPGAAPPPDAAATGGSAGLASADGGSAVTTTAAAAHEQAGSDNTQPLII